MNIRLAKESDYEAVVRLVSELMIELGFREFDAEGVDEIFMDFIQSEARGYVMLAESNENICGVCTVSIVMALRTKGVYGIIQEMYVLPGIRGQGIGEKLLEAALGGDKPRRYTIKKICRSTHSPVDQMQRRLVLNPLTWENIFGHQWEEIG